MVARKTVCLRRLGGNRKGEERVGRFFANPKVTASKIIAGWGTQTDAACAGRHVLLVEDRSEVKFPTTAQRRRGLGPVKKGNAYTVVIPGTGSNGSYEIDDSGGHDTTTTTSLTQTAGGTQCATCSSVIYAQASGIHGK